MPLVEFLRQYTLREYGAVLLMALAGAGALVLMLNMASGGAASGEQAVLLKQQSARVEPKASVRYVEAQHVAAAEKAKEQALIQARQRKIQAARNVRAARRAAAVARARAAAPRRTTVRRTPTVVAPVPTRVVNTSPSPAPRPTPAPAPRPTPQKSGTVGGGGGSFDDSG
jgi:hypothetical protein